MSLIPQVAVGVAKFTESSTQTVTLYRDSRKVLESKVSCTRLALLV